MSQRNCLAAIATMLLVVGCAGESPKSTNTAAAGGTLAPAAFSKTERAMYAPLPAAITSNGQLPAEALITLGRSLFYEPVLSNSHDVSCNGCHALNGWGADGRKVSLGHDGTAGNRNSPTVYNAAGSLAQFWDGRAADVEAQAKGPILNPVEMGMPDSVAVLAHMRGSATYVALFHAAFPGERQPISYDNVGRAIGAFERGLVTPSRWDRFLAGDSTALSDAEQQGLRTFLDAGCQSCHSGAYVGGSSFQKAGIVNAWYSQADSGRFQVTHDPKDLFVFKVPSLRNIDKTGPYFHDGSVATLDEAVRLMAHHQLGKELAPAQVQSIVTWLGSLTGEIPLRYIAFPQQPK